MLVQLLSQACRVAAYQFIGSSGLRLRVAKRHQWLPPSLAQLSAQLHSMADTYPGLPESWTEDLKDGDGVALSKR